MVYVCLLFAAAAVGYALGCHGAAKRVVEHTVIRTDTVRIVRPEIVAVHVRGQSIRRTLPVVSADSARKDSATVIIPVETKVYADSTYRAYVSGYNVSLDSLVTLRTVASTSVFSGLGTARRRPAVTIGLQAGYGITPRGLQPYVGLGIGLSLTF